MYGKSSLTLIALLLLGADNAFGQYGQQGINESQEPVYGTYPGSQETKEPSSYSASGLPYTLKRPVNAQIYQWFIHFDKIRRFAQMNPAERQQADSLMSRGLSLFIPGQDKLAARDILAKLVARYRQALVSLTALPLLSETAQLQKGYYQYFDNAGKLFADYLRVQDNFMAQDANGQPLAGQLLQRKAMLETLERSIKELDGQMRLAYGVAPYQY